MKFLTVIPLLLALAETASTCNHQDALASASPVSPDTLRGRITAIKDGDTFELLADRKQITIRLSDIDCPEKKQPFGTRAKQFASDLCFGREVIAIKKARPDRYGRMIAEVYEGTTCINRELVKNGMAWHFTKYSRDSSYALLEQSARKNKLGIWSEKKPTAPWEWRAPSKRAIKNHD